MAADRPAVRGLLRIAAERSHTPVIFGLRRANERPKGKGARSRTQATGWRCARSSDRDAAGSDANAARGLAPDRGRIEGQICGPWAAIMLERRRTVQGFAPASGRMKCRCRCPLGRTRGATDGRTVEGFAPRPQAARLDMLRIVFGPSERPPGDRNRRDAWLLRALRGACRLTQAATPRGGRKATGGWRKRRPLLRCWRSLAWPAAAWA